MAEVQLKNVSKSYDSKHKVINDVNLTISDKEFLVLVGSSGCGKSTVLRMIAGLETITDGQILIDGKVVNNLHPKDRDIAFVFQNYALYPHMSVYDNIAFPLKMRKYDKKTIDEKVKNAAEILNLTDLLKRKPKQLSGGQRQRVALGRAIVRNPKVFLMDEPLSNLDAKLRVQMRSEIKKLHEKLQTTFIYVTHDQTEALTMGDRIAIIDKGVIQQVDTPDNVYKNPTNTFVAGFLGSPSMNFIPVDIENGFVTINDEKVYLHDAAKQKLNGYSKCIMGIRPEKMNVQNPYFSLSVKVDLWEILGGEKIAYFYLNGNKCSAKYPAEMQTTDKIKLNISFNDIMYFDVDTLLKI